MDVGRLREHARALGFTPQDQVRWLAPGELLRTAVKVVLSSLFADYADRREVQAALPATTLTLAPDADGGLWFDHVADLGDGFDSTYTVARLHRGRRRRGRRAARRAGPAACACRAAGCSCSAATRSTPRRPRPATRTA